MADQTKVICFTDLKDSTRLTEGLGHEGFLPHVWHHLSVGRTLAEGAGGAYVKNIGDALMLAFDSPLNAIRFASRFQQFCVGSAGLGDLTPGVKIGLALGTVEKTETDYFGSGVNQASRVQGEAEPGRIVVNKALRDSLARTLGQRKTDLYLASIGEKTLKGVEDPPKQELFAFDWAKYGRDVPDQGLAGCVYKHLQQAQVETSNLTVKDVTNPGTIIWPVAPRDIVTAIHQGQAEIIRLLALLGWHVKVLVADCGAKGNHKRSYSEPFADRLIGYLRGRGVEPLETEFMSDLYQPTHDGYDQIQTLFRAIASKLTVQDLLNINSKGYTQQVKDEIRSSATLDCLRPALSLAAVTHLAGQSSEKSIVVAGQDESTQWQLAYTLLNKRSLFGVLMNPVLKIGPVDMARQKSDWPSWPSPMSLARDMETANLAWWVFHLHAYVPAFPSEYASIEGSSIAPNDWQTDLEIPADLSRYSLANHVWPLLESPA